MSKVKKFIQDMKDQYDMNDAEVLEAIQTESQHDFICNSQHVGINEASEIIIKAEEYLLDIVDVV